MFVIIAAVGQKGEMGKDGDLVFQIKEDMRFFKETTWGHKVLMGRKTFWSLPGVLKGRENYVLTSRPKELPGGVIPVTDLEALIEKYRDSEEVVFVIGGASVYSALLPYAKTIYLTEIEASVPADTFFPKFDQTGYHKSIIKKGEEHGLKYTFVKYIKK